MLSRDLGFRVVEMEEFYDRRARAVAAMARELVGDAPVYVTFDVDALDPAYALGAPSALRPLPSALCPLPSALCPPSAPPSVRTMVDGPPMDP